MVAGNSMGADVVVLMEAGVELGSSISGASVGVSIMGSGCFSGISTLEPGEPAVK